MVDTGPADPSRPVAAGATAGGAAQPAGRVERVLGVLRSVLPVARGVRFAVTVLAAIAAGGVLAFGLAWATSHTPDDPLEWVALVVLCGVLLIPSGLLLGARWMLSGLIELPRRLRAEPGVRREQLDQLAALAARDGGATGRSGLDDPADPVRAGGPVRRAWRAGRIVVGARGDLLAYTALLRLASLSYLASTFVAAGFALLEVLVLYPTALVLVLVG